MTYTTLKHAAIVRNIYREGEKLLPRAKNRTKNTQPLVIESIGGGEELDNRWTYLQTKH